MDQLFYLIYIHLDIQSISDVCISKVLSWLLHLQRMLLYVEVVAIVERKVGENSFQDMCEFVAPHIKSLYGLRKPRGFVKAVVALVLYHDLKGVGWTQLEVVRGAPIKVAHSSLQHNSKIVRKILNSWALQHITPGSLNDWKRAARHAAFGQHVKDVTLAIDSFDLGIQKQGNNCGKASPYWSYKLNQPGWRFMLIIDASTEIRCCSAGYSPKVYDGHWMEARRDYLETNFKGGVFVADGHFTLGQALDDVIIHIPTRQRRTTAAAAEDADIERLTAKEGSRNTAIHQARARVETTIHALKQPWKILKEPWAEELNQLSYLVHIACAVHNLCIRV